MSSNQERQVKETEKSKIDRLIEEALRYLAFLLEKGKNP